MQIDISYLSLELQSHINSFLLILQKKCSDGDITFSFICGMLEIKLRFSSIARLQQLLKILKVNAIQQEVTLDDITALLTNLRIVG